MLHHARLIILGAAGAAVAAAWLASARLGVDTDTAALLDPDLPFRQSYAEFHREFPLLVDGLIAVVDGVTAEQALDAARALASELRLQPQSFATVLVDGDEAYLRRNALLLLEADELQRHTAELIDGQAFLGMLARDPSLHGLARGLTSLLDAADSGDRSRFERLLSAMRGSLTRDPADPAVPLSWLALFAPAEQPPATRRLVLIEPRLDFTALLPAQAAMTAARSAISMAADSVGPGVRIRLTGDAALAHEEMSAALADAGRTGVLALGAIALILVAGLGSVWLAAACLASLITGLALTAGVATLAVGRLNLISTAFGLLYVGLAVDYSIHFCLVYREQLARTDHRQAALDATAAVLRKPLLWCTLTTMTGFLAFMPTAFRGVADLGLIGAAGMGINLILTLTLLPALLWYAPLPRPWPAPAHSAPGSSPGTLGIRMLAAVALLGAVLALAVLPAPRFDRDPLGLRDPHSESVRTLRDLMAADAATAGALTVVSADLAQARALAARLDTLAQVETVVYSDRLVPRVDAARRARVDDLALLVAPAVASTPAAPASAQQAFEALQGLQASLERFARRSGSAVAAGLADDLARWFRHRADAPAGDSRLEELDRLIVGHLPRALDQLAEMLNPDLDTAPMLPPGIRGLWVSDTGHQRLLVIPRHPPRDDAERRAFIAAVRAVAPGATGEVVLALEAGDAVVQAFLQAFALALVIVVALLMGMMRRLTDVGLTVLALATAGLLGAAALALAGGALNFANVIALPLLFGMGVDGAIHMGHEARRRRGTDTPVRATLGRAIGLSALTTIAGSTNLMLATHPGMASLGTLLAIGTAAILFATLIVMPAALAWRDRTP